MSSPLNAGRASASAGLVLALLIAVLGGSVFARLLRVPTTQVTMATFATSLEGRSAAQRFNARLAAQALDGAAIAPGATFSFVQAVRAWSAREGYVKAPVSFDGELIKAYGGGVCQTSTTLYNAALLACLRIRERHPHIFKPRYIGPGRDAAVAFPGVDLRFSNPYPWPVRIRAGVEGDLLQVRLIGAHAPAAPPSIVTEVLSTTLPGRITLLRTANGDPSYARFHGMTGMRCVTYRITRDANGTEHRELLSDDDYEAMDGVVAISAQ